MDTFLNIIVVLAIAVVVFLAAGFVGFRVPAPLRWPAGEPAAPLSTLSADIELPPLAKKWLFQGASSTAAPGSLVAWGRGKIASHLPIFGKTWLPLSWTLYIIPGKNFIIQNRITWFRRRFIRGGEEYRNGKGSFILGSNATDNPFLDETERALVWLYSIWLAPASLIKMNDVSLEQTDERNLRLVVEQDQQSTLQFGLEIDPATGFIQKIIGTRKGSRTGGDYPYIASLAKPNNYGKAGNIPSQYTGNWDNDLYIRLELAGTILNQDISAAMQTGVEAMPPL
jgi:hypothetical protein